LFVVVFVVVALDRLIDDEPPLDEFAPMAPDSCKRRWSMFSVFEVELELESLPPPKLYTRPPHCSLWSSCLALIELLSA
jgi:hypothetical protein